MKRKASRERGERDEDEGGGGGVVGRPVAERKGLLLRLDCSLSGTVKLLIQTEYGRGRFKGYICAGIGSD